ncbi:MAG TPA: hypothetical protein VJ840_14275 [Gemmatimonadaceae bacterium]|nr:hypothetical protein [Gemmatimonadaceae bacterium]
MAVKQKTDLGAALTGFVLAGVTLFLVLTSIVLLTNAKYRHHGEEAPAATQPK